MKKVLILIATMLTFKGMSQGTVQSLPSIPTFSVSCIEVLHYVTHLDSIHIPNLKEGFLVHVDSGLLGFKVYSKNKKFNWHIKVKQAFRPSSNEYCLVFAEDSSLCITVDESKVREAIIINPNYILQIF